MSESDSFLSEVTEEVRRDRMIRFFRRNAIYIAAAVIVIIGTAVVLEWRRSSAQSAAQARGDALWAALEEEDAGARAAALAPVEISGESGAALLNLHRAAALLGAGETADAVTLLQSTATAAGVDSALRDVARLKLATIRDDALAPQERLNLLDVLSAEGHAFRGLALEQRALLHIENGDMSAASTDMQAVLDDAATTDALRLRVARLMLALGLTPEDTAQDG